MYVMYNMLVYSCVDAALFVKVIIYSVAKGSPGQTHALTSLFTSFNTIQTFFTFYYLPSTILYLFATDQIIISRTNLWIATFHLLSIRIEQKINSFSIMQRKTDILLWKIDELLQ